MILFIFLIAGMLTFLESFCEACADGDICTPVSLHYAVLVFALLPSLGKFPRLESFYEACADEDIYTPLFLHTDTGMQRSPFALSPDDFIHIYHIRYAYLFRKPLRGLCRWGHLHTGIFALCGTSFCFITQLR
ncbi:MAG: hypothetical protein WCY96_00740 [Candidatus Cloacimonadaceae bacterium]